MNRRLRSFLIIFVTLALIYFVLQPLLYSLVLSSKISLENYRLLYFSINLSVTIVIAIILFIKGRYISGIRPVAILIILNALMDFNRIESYPIIAMNSNVVTMFAGVFIFAFGLVAAKMAIFKKGSGIFFFLLGGIYLLRFPMFMDLLFFASKKFIQDATPVDFYFFGTLYLNYIVVFFELIALDSVFD